LNIWKFLKEVLEEVKRQMADLKDSPEWGDICQQVLRADTGMGVYEFAMFAVTMGSRQCQAKEVAGTVNPCMLWNLDVILTSLEEARAEVGDAALGPDLVAAADGLVAAREGWSRELASAGA